MSTITEASSRNVGLEPLVTLLRDQSTRRLDVIAGSGAIRAEHGQLVLDRTAPQLGSDGVTMTTGSYALNDVATAGLADKLTIPLPYTRRMLDHNVELFDANVNSWLQRTDRRFLVRVLRNDTGGGLVRAFLSDKYARLDHLDVLMAALDGVRRAGTPIEIDGCDLTDRRMFVRVHSPQVQALAPQLLANYRSPFDNRAGADLPVVWGGFVITNSETGCGAFTIAPRLVVQVCRNGMVMSHNALRRTHLGSRHETDGVIEPSDETNTKTLELITSRTRDAVAAYLNTTYVSRMIRELESVAGKPVEQPDHTIKIVAQRLRVSEQDQQDLLAHFIKGADLTAGGVMHAITSLAQTLPDADTAHELESNAVQAMHIAATA